MRKHLSFIFAELALFAGASMIDAWLPLSSGWIWTIVFALSIVAIVMCYRREIVKYVRSQVGSRRKTVASFRVIEDTPTKPKHLKITPAQLLSIIKKKYTNLQRRSILGPMLGGSLIIEGPILNTLEEKGTDYVLVIVRVGLRSQACLRLKKDVWWSQDQSADRIRVDGILKNVENEIIFLDDCEILSSDH